MGDVADLLERVAIFKDLNGDELRQVADVCKREQFTSGEYIFREGEHGNRLYLIVHGEVRISRDVPGSGEEALAVLKPGALFGEMAVFDRTERSTHAISNGGTTVLSISRPDFEMLLDWLGEAQLDRVGCFKYEPVAGAVANDLAAPVPDEVKEERWHRFMQRQQAISAKRLKAKVGTRQQVIIDEVGPTVAKGRTKGDAPEIDGAVYVASRRPLRVGEISTVKIERADDYDLHGMAVGY